MLTAMAWSNSKIAAAQSKAHLSRATDVPKVLNRLVAIMALQMEFIELGERALISRRLQLLCILLQANLIIVVKAYHLVMFMIRVLFHNESASIDLTTAFLYFGYPTVSQTLNLMLTIVAFSLLNQSFTKMLRHLNKFYIYAANDALRLRLGQFSANLNANLQSYYTIYGVYAINGRLLATMLANKITYITILIQYSLGDVCYTPATNQTCVEHQ